MVCDLPRQGAGVPFFHYHQPEAGRQCLIRAPMPGPTSRCPCPAGPQPPAKTVATIRLNVVFIHSAGDSQDDGTIWVYRYRRIGRGGRAPDRQLRISPTPVRSRCATASQKQCGQSPQLLALRQQWHTVARNAG
jgi:hypothetical protein